MRRATCNSEVARVFLAFLVLSALLFDMDWASGREMPAPEELVQAIFSCDEDGANDCVYLTPPTHIFVALTRPDCPFLRHSAVVSNRVCVFQYATGPPQL